jgi:hypothetical protein
MRVLDGEAELAVMGHSLSTHLRSADRKFRMSRNPTVIPAKLAPE